MKDYWILLSFGPGLVLVKPALDQKFLNSSVCWVNRVVLLPDFSILLTFLFLGIDILGFSSRDEEIFILWQKFLKICFLSKTLPIDICFLTYPNPFSLCTLSISYSFPIFSLSLSFPRRIDGGAIKIFTVSKCNNRFCLSMHTFIQT